MATKKAEAPKEEPSNKKEKVEIQKFEDPKPTAMKAEAGHVTADNKPRPKPPEKVKRKYPLKPYEELATGMTSITIKVTEEVKQAFEDNNRDIQQEGSDLLSSQAIKLGWI
jgi:hypothetical protein